MADVLFRYLLMARRHDAAWSRRLLLQDAPFTSAGVEQVVETAAARLTVHAQFAQVSYEPRAWPASKQDEIPFVDVATPNPPTFCEARTERFALRNTKRLAPCADCEGTGELVCYGCQGVPPGKCKSCRAVGRIREPGGRWVECIDCGGTGQAICHECAGRGRVRHLTCGGEGGLVLWRDEVHTYFTRWEGREVLPEDAPPSLARTVEAWLEQHPELVGGLDEQVMAEHLGYSSASVQGVARSIRQMEREMKGRLFVEGAKRLFTTEELRLVPVACCTSRAERQVVRYWLVGRGDEALEIAPPTAVEPSKALGWGGLLTAALVPLMAPAVGVPVLAAGAAAAAVGLWRVLRAAPQARTIAVVPTFGEATSYVILVAALGSHLGQLHVFDRAYADQLHALLGQPVSPRQSNTVTLALADGSLVRLVEVAHAAQLGPEAFRRMVQSVDGVLYLERAADEGKPLQARIEEVRGASVPSAALLVGEGGVPLELIRQAFVDGIEPAGGWAALWNRLAAPFLRENSGERLQ